MESEIEITDDGSKGLFEKIKDWSYENWQTLLIILIVLIVGISAYNYNQNNANNNSNPAVVNNENESEENSGNNSQNSEIADNNLEENNQEIAIENMDQEEAAKEDEKTKEPVKEETINENTNNNENEEPAVSSSDNSGKQYAETAVFGDGITHLARRALEEYIQETGDGANLTKEKKIYIEDYMQNRTGSEKINIGHQETFSESLIEEAISNANNLSEKSLENIKKYIK